MKRVNGEQVDSVSRYFELMRSLKEHAALVATLESLRDPPLALQVAVQELERHSKAYVEAWQRMKALSATPAPGTAFSESER